MSKLLNFIKEYYEKMVNSIAFYPAIIVLLFLALSYLSISFDFSEKGMQLKSQIEWLKLKDSSTVRVMASSIAAGIISLSVFSFSMVMIVLNQTASRMSNRILDKLIGRNFQQVVLGIFIGTAVYALLLLSMVRDIDTGTHIPVISSYLLILLVIIDLFLFVYFLHYITQSIKYKDIIGRIQKATKEVMSQNCTLKEEAEMSAIELHNLIFSLTSGIYKGFNKLVLVHLCEKYGFTLYFMHAPGTFILKGTAIIAVNKNLSEKVKIKILNAVYVHSNQTIEDNFIYGFNLLSEVAIKALSPGINDPGTAIECLRSLFQLYAFRASNFPDNTITDKKKQVKIVTNNLSFERIFTETLLPIWDYGKNDRLVQDELSILLTQLQSVVFSNMVNKMLNEVQNSLKARELSL
jgi:uncharacterized membrane protein